MNPYYNDIKNAVSYFWKIRDKQGEAQGSDTGIKDSGNRTKVTGGAQLNGFIELFSKIAKETD